MTKAIGVDQDGEVVWHAHGVSNDYDTLCGMDANDPHIGHHGLVDAKRGQRITCVVCHTIWSNTVALKLRQSDFDVK